LTIALFLLLEAFAACWAVFLGVVFDDFDYGVEGFVVEAVDVVFAVGF
jgi:hypothetical protein